MAMPMRLAALLLLTAPLLAEEGATLPERYLAHETLAFDRYEASEWAQAIPLFEAQIALYPPNPRPYYNIACCYALLGNAPRAAIWIELAIGHGWRDLDHLSGDTDFESVRESAEYARAVVHLLQARAEDPDPLPRWLSHGSVPGAASARALIVATEFEAGLALRADLPEDEGAVRRRLFPIYDRRMALFGRYVAENGDARDADRAARERVRTALLYLQRADAESAADRPLVEAAARLAAEAAEDFVRRYGGSPHLPEVLFWRAAAKATLGGDPASLYRTLAADHPESEYALRGLVELCARLADGGNRKALAEVYVQLEERDGAERLMRMRLTKARLLVRGLPEEVRSLANAKGTATALCFVSPRAEGSIEAIARLRAAALRVVVLSVDDPSGSSDDEVAAWLREHASGLDTVARAGELADACWLASVPAIVVANAFGRVLFVDPTDEELLLLPQGR